MSVEKNVADLRPDKAQAKRPITEAYLESLGQSMLDKGQLHSLHIMPDGLIITGERRWLAAKRKGIKKLRCIEREDLLKYSGEKLQSEFRAIRMGENYHRGKEGISLYYAKECKAQQEYYRSLSDKELLEEIKQTHFLKNGSKSKFDRDTLEGRFRKILGKKKGEKVTQQDIQKADFYALTAREFNFLDKSGKPRADTVRKNVQLLDDTVDEVKKQLEAEEDLPVSERKIHYSHLEETHKITLDDPRQVIEKKQLQKEIAEGMYPTSRHVRTVVKAIREGKSKRVINCVKAKFKSLRKAGDVFTEDQQNGVIKEAEKEVEEETKPKPKKKQKQTDFEDFINECRKDIDRLRQKIKTLVDFKKDFDSDYYSKTFAKGNFVYSAQSLMKRIGSLLKEEGYEKEGQAKEERALEPVGKTVGKK